jgi:hypothetical protein
LNVPLTLWENEERHPRVLFVITLMFADTFASWVEMCHWDATSAETTLPLLKRYHLASVWCLCTVKQHMSQKDKEYLIHPPTQTERQTHTNTNT